MQTCPNPLRAPGSLANTWQELERCVYRRCSTEVEGDGVCELPAREDVRCQREPEAAGLDPGAAGAVLAEDLGHRVGTPLHPLHHTRVQQQLRCVGPLVKPDQVLPPHARSFRLGGMRAGQRSGCTQPPLWAGGRRRRASRLSQADRCRWVVCNRRHPPATEQHNTGVPGALLHASGARSLQHGHPCSAAALHARHGAGRAAARMRALGPR